MDQEIQWLLQEKYRGEHNRGFARDVTRLKKGKPLAYLIGFVHFFGCVIDLSKKPLIPRPETEFWVKKAVVVMHSSKTSNALKVLDMFAGSGCLGVSIMRHIPSAKVLFVEKNRNLIPQIALNCSINEILKKRWHAVQSDVFSNVRGRFDIVVANPPYIPLKKKGRVHASVMRHEPRMALFGGDDGLFYIRKFLDGVRDFLNKEGVVFMEFDPPQKKEIEKMCKAFGYKEFRCHRDQYGKWRYLVAVK